MVFEARGLDDPGIAIPVTDRLGAVGESLQVGATGLVMSEVGLAEEEECVVGVVPRFGVTKLV